MRRPNVLALFSLAVLLGVLPSTVCASISYNFVDYSSNENGYHIAGFVTTDGFTGTISQASTSSHILSFSLTVSKGSNTVSTISSSNGGILESSNDGFTITPTAIVPYLTGSTQGGGIAMGYSGYPIYAIAGFVSGNHQVTLFDSTPSTVLWDTSMPGNNNPIAAVASVPEPGSLSLALAGVAGMAWTGWRRRRHSGLAA
jgi:PEP-CTERM motif